MNANEPCNHTDSERCIYGFFADVEIVHALSMGYKLKDVYQTIVYNTTARNCKEFKGREFIRQCMYYKTLYSKVTDYNEDVLKGLKLCLDIDYNIIDAEHIQIRLNATAPWEFIKLNAAMKKIYKLLMNAVYGKLGMDIVTSSFSIDKDPKELNTAIYNNINPFKCGEYVYTRYEEAAELQQLKGCQSNHFVSAYITALGRTALYQLQEYIKKEYDGEMLYGDTDSVYCVLPIKYANI